jgi:hypothetical protein
MNVVNKGGMNKAAKDGSVGGRRLDKRDQVVV